MSRPKKKIEWEIVDRMLEAGCNGTEVAASLGIHPDTLYLRCEEENNMGFSAYLSQKRAVGDRLLKMEQFRLALEGDRTMLVWLGKQRLRQSDKAAHLIGHVSGNNMEGLEDADLEKRVLQLTQSNVIEIPGESKEG